MKKHFVAFGFDGKVLLSGTKESDGICVNQISSKLSGSEFSSVDDVLMHPEVERSERSTTRQISKAYHHAKRDYF